VVAATNNAPAAAATATSLCEVGGLGGAISSAAATNATTAIVVARSVGDHIADVVICR
jgi:succinate-acetate transporter protein